MFVLSSGSYLPNNKVTNIQLEEIFGSTASLIGDYFGVDSRHYVVDYKTGENRDGNFFCHMAVEAIKNATKDIGEIDLIISCTNTPDYTLPQASALIQEKLGIKTAKIFDINGGCSSPLQGIILASSLIESGFAKTAAVVGGECFSAIYYKYLLSKRNEVRASELMASLIFGDGVACVILSSNPKNAILEIEFSGINSKNITRQVGFNVAWGGSSLAVDKKLEDMDMFMKHFPKNIQNNLPDVVKDAVMEIEAKYKPFKSFDYIIGPQANKRLLDQTNKALKTSDSYFYYGSEVGNVPGGALLIALDKLLKTKEIAKGQEILLMGIESPKWLYSYIGLQKL